MVKLIMPHLYLNKYYTVDYLKTSAISYDEDFENLELSGINTLKTILAMQGKPFIFSFLGGNVGKHIKKILLENNIKYEFIYTRSNCEIKLNIFDRLKDSNLVLEGAPKDLTEKAYTLFLQSVSNIKSNVDTILIDQRYFKNEEEAFFINIIKQYSLTHNKLILNIDTNKSWYETYKDFITPYAIVYTLNDDNELYLKSIDDIAEYYSDALNARVHFVIINIYNKGMLFMSKTKRCFMDNTTVYNKIKYVYSSDAILGMVTIGIDRKYELEKICKLAFGGSMSVIETRNKHRYSQNNILKHRNKHKLIELMKINKNLSTKTE